MVTEVKPKVAVNLAVCPFCGATPHRGKMGVQYDQLHGEPFQRYRVWCPHGCASLDRVNAEQAIAAWNRRSPPIMTQSSTDSLVHRLRGPHRRSECGNFVEVHPDFLNEAAIALTAAEAKVARLGEALAWSMDEIDILSNKMSGFAYPQGMVPARRRDQLDNYRKAVDARRSADREGGE